MVNSDIRASLDIVTAQTERDATEAEVSAKQAKDSATQAKASATQAENSIKQAPKTAENSSERTNNVNEEAPIAINDRLEGIELFIKSFFAPMTPSEKESAREKMGDFIKSAPGSVQAKKVAKNLLTKALA